MQEFPDLINLQKQKGNALFLILIAVALFAALAYAVTRTGQGGSGGPGKEQLRLEAANIIGYANLVEQTVNRMRLINGCTDTTITFENSVVSGYAYAGSPADKSCNVFDPAGGGLAFQSPKLSVLDPAQSAQTRYGQYYFTASTCIDGLGPTGAGDSVTGCHLSSVSYDIFLTLMYVRSDVCKEINNILGWNWSTIPTDANAILRMDKPFVGAYPVTSVRIETPITAAKPMGCIESNGAGAGFMTPLGTYHFVYAIFPR